MYVKCLEISFTSRIGLLDKLVQVSSPILLALQLIDIEDFQYVCSTTAVLSSAAYLPIKYLKLKTKTNHHSIKSLSPKSSWHLMHNMLKVVIKDRCVLKKWVDSHRALSRIELLRS